MRLFFFFLDELSKYFVLTSLHRIQAEMYISLTGETGILEWKGNLKYNRNVSLSGYRDKKLPEIVEHRRTKNIGSIQVGQPHSHININNTYLIINISSNISSVISLILILYYLGILLITDNGLQP